VDLTISDKTDVFSFGVVLLEVVSGGKYMKMVQENPIEAVLDRPVEDIIDPNIKCTGVLESLFRYHGKMCEG